MEKTKKEPATAATVTDSGKKMDEMMMTVHTDYNTSQTKCQEIFCKLRKDVFEISGIADDVLLLLNDTLQYFDFTSKRYLVYPDEGRKWFEEFYDILAAKIRITCNRMQNVCDMMDEII